MLGGRNKGAGGNLGMMDMFIVLNVVMVSWAYSHIKTCTFFICTLYLVLIIIKNKVIGAYYPHLK